MTLPEQWAMGRLVFTDAPWSGIDAWNVHDILGNQDQQKPIAIVWNSQIPDIKEWHVYCFLCPAPPSEVRGIGRTRSFLSLERAAKWYNHHLSHSHPGEVACPSPSTPAGN